MLRSKDKLSWKTNHGRSPSASTSRAASSKRPPKGTLEGGGGPLISAYSTTAVRGPTPRYTACTSTCDG